MKKVLLTLCFLFAFTFTSSAQSGWSITYKKADELLGEKAVTSFMYKSLAGSFVFWDNTEERFRLNTYKGIFNYHGQYMRFLATVGIYDSDNNLVKSMKVIMSCPSDQPSSAFSYSDRKDKKLAKDIISFLKTPSDGYIRIVAPIYGSNPDLDIKIPCLAKDLD